MGFTYSVIYINGKTHSPIDAKISVFDRGFLYSDGVYEVVPFHSKKLFLLDEHIDRLKRSLSEVQIPIPNDDFHSLSKKLVQDHNSEDGILYIQVTRGAGLQRFHTWNEGELTPTVVALCQTMNFAMPEGGLKVITSEDNRWGRCDIKAIGLLPNVILRQKAHEQGCHECILIRDGHVSEGTSSNFFIVSNGKVITPTLEHNILPGITRDFCIQVLKKHGFEFEESQVELQDLLGADEVWLTSSTKDVQPVVQMDGKAVGSGEPGPIWQKFSQLYHQEKQSKLTP